MTHDAREDDNFWRQVHRVARKAAREELLRRELDGEIVLPTKPRPRRPRKDIGKTILWDPEDFDKRLREILELGNVTVQRVLDGTGIKSRTSLRRYLKPYERSLQETPAQIIHRLEREWFPQNSLL